MADILQTLEQTLMRALIIDDKAKDQIGKVVSYAESHHYHPGSTNKVPGDNPEFVANLGTYRVVFTFTHADGLVYRHISISVPSKDYANPAAAFMIAHHFGFTGWDENKPSDLGSGWLLHVNKEDHCIIIAQPIANDTLVTH